MRQNSKYYGYCCAAQENHRKMKLFVHANTQNIKNVAEWLDDRLMGCSGGWLVNDGGMYFLQQNTNKKHCADHNNQLLKPITTPPHILLGSFVLLPDRKP